MNNNITINELNKLLSNDKCDEQSKLHSHEINYNNKLVNNPIKENSFQMGFYCARKILNDYINERSNSNT